MDAGTSDDGAPVTQLEHVTEVLRGRILSGAFKPGARLMEVPLAEMLGASRTPVRLALARLQQEHLVVAGGPRRGFVVNSFTLDEVFDAIEARGTLEGLAARRAAEQGLSEASAAKLRACVDLGARLLSQGGGDDCWGEAWARNNAEYHAGLVEASGNRAIAVALEPLCRIPLTAPSAVVLRTSDPANDLHRLRRAQDDHRDILTAIEAGQGSRAEMLLREHAMLNIRNKLLNFNEIKTIKAAGNLPGLDLVGTGGEDGKRPRNARRRAATGAP